MIIRKDIGRRVLLMRSMRQLLAAILMASMIATTGGMTVSAATPQTKGISVQADDQSAMSLS